MDPDYAALVHALGVSSLGAPDKAIWALTRVYWHTVEFGVVWEDSVPKAFGAGILSSPGELAHFSSGVAALTPLDPRAPLPKMAYKEGYQARYFTLPSFAEGAEMLREYAAEMTSVAVRSRFGLVGLGAGRLVPQGVDSLKASAPVPKEVETVAGSALVPAETDGAMTPSVLPLPRGALADAARPGSPAPEEEEAAAVGGGGGGGGSE